MWLAQSSVHQCRWRLSLGHVSGPTRPACSSTRGSADPCASSGFRFSASTLLLPADNRPALAQSWVRTSPILSSSPSCLSPPSSCFLFLQCISQKLKATSTLSTAHPPRAGDQPTRICGPGPSQGPRGHAQGSLQHPRSLPFGTDSISDDSGKGEEKQGTSDLKISARELSGRWGIVWGDLALRWVGGGGGTELVRGTQMNAPTHVHATFTSDSPNHQEKVT